MTLNTPAVRTTDRAISQALAMLEYDENSPRRARVGDKLSIACERRRGTPVVCLRPCVKVESELARQILDGFGVTTDGQDRFDAVIGMFGMVNVLEKRCSNSSRRHG